MKASQKFVIFCYGFKVVSLSFALESIKEFIKPETSLEDTWNLHIGVGRPFPGGQLKSGHRDRQSSCAHLFGHRLDDDLSFKQRARLYRHRKEEQSSGAFGKKKRREKAN